MCGSEWWVDSSPGTVLGWCKQYMGGDGWAWLTRCALSQHLHGGVGGHVSIQETSIKATVGSPFSFCSTESKSDWILKNFLCISLMTHVEHLFMNVCFFFFCFPFHELIDHLYFFFGRVSVQMLGISISWMPFSISFPLFLVCWVFLSRKDDVGLFFFPFLKSIMMRYFAFFFFKNNFIYLFLTVLGLHCCWDFSLVVASWGYSLVVCALIIAVASLVVIHGLICSAGSNYCLLHWQADCLPLSH